MANAKKNIPADTKKGIFLCVAKQLPEELRVKAAQNAIRINPKNATPIEKVVKPSVERQDNGPETLSGSYSVQAQADLALKGLSGELDGMPPARLAVDISKYWGCDTQLTVQFMDKPKPPTRLRKKILSHMNAWGRYGNVEFIEVKSGGDVRITFKDHGYWSYVGTDILSIEGDQPTMSLEGFSLSTPDEEFYRVVRHETGHTLGYQHEHARREIVDRIDEEKAIAYFESTDGWDEESVRNNVLTPLAESSVWTTDIIDEDSIMCYSLPGEIMKDNEEVWGGKDISVADGHFTAVVYPIVILNNTYYIRVPNSICTVDLYSNILSDNNAVWSFNRNFSSAQSWVITHMRDGLHKIVRVNSNKALTVRAGTDFEGAQAVIREFYDTPSMLWRFFKNDNGTYTIINSESGLALTLKDNKKGFGAPLIVCTDDGSEYGQFCLNSTEDIPDGTYYIKVADTELAVDCCAGGTQEGDRIRACTCNQADSQKWTISKVSGDIYKVINVSTNKSMAYRKNDAFPQSVRMLEYKSEPEMQWRIVRNSDYTYAFAFPYANTWASVLTINRPEEFECFKMSQDALKDGQRFILQDV